MICQDCLCNFFLYFNLLIRFNEVIEFFFPKETSSGHNFCSLKYINQFFWRMVQNMTTNNISFSKFKGKPLFKYQRISTLLAPDTH